MRRIPGLLFLVLLVGVGAEAQPRPRAVVGTEIYRRTTARTAIIRIYQGETLISETTTSPGDLRITYQEQFVVTPGISSFTAPSVLQSGGTANASVGISPTPTTPQTITFTSSNTVALPAPAPITLNAGNVTGTVVLKAGPVSQTTLVNLRATLGATSRLLGIRIDPSPSVSLSGLTLAPNPARPGQDVTAVFTFTRAPAQGISVPIQATGSALALPVALVSVPAGVTQHTLTIPVRNVTAEETVTLTATYGTTRTATLRVLPETPPPPPPPPPGTSFYVAPNGSATNAGTIDSPWDLESAVNGTHRAKLAAGGTVWLFPGTYRKSPNPEGLGFRCTVGGTEATPLIFRGFIGQRITIDGGWSFMAGSRHTWLWGVEIHVSDLVEGKPPFGTSGSWPAGAPNGGLNFYESVNCRGINLFLHNNRQGSSLWQPAQNVELYGSVIWDNGWVGTDRAHGHGTYIQNPPSTTKKVVDCIYSARNSVNWRDGRYTMHGYGESAPVTNITVEGCFLYTVRDAWLLGNGAPSTGSTRMVDNVIHGVRVRVVSSSTQRAEMVGNIIARGQLEVIGPQVSQTANLIAPPQPLPTSPTVVLRPNQYEPWRAQLMVVDWQQRGTVRVDPSAFIKAGDYLKVMDPLNFWGAPLWEGNYPAGGIDLPVPGGARAFLLVKEVIWPGPQIAPPGRPGLSPEVSGLPPPPAAPEEAPVLPALRP